MQKVNSIALTKLLHVAHRYVICNYTLKLKEHIFDISFISFLFPNHANEINQNSGVISKLVTFVLQSVKKVGFHCKNNMIVFHCFADILFSVKKKLEMKIKQNNFWKCESVKMSGKMRPNFGLFHM